MRRSYSTRTSTTLALVASLGLVAAACSDSATPSPTISATPDVEQSPVTAGLTTTTALAADAEMPGLTPQLIELVHADGTPFELAAYHGGDTLLFFGYSHCPDVCPTTIGEIFGVFEALPETRAIFVSVDPERDTPEFLEEWTQYFPDNFDAVTGSPGAIRRAADEFGVKYARVETTSTAGYTMSHTADMYRIGQDGQVSSTYPFGTPASEIIDDLGSQDAG